MYIPNFSFLAQFGGKIGKEQQFFKYNKGIIPHIPPLDTLYHFEFSIDRLKKEKFLHFRPSEIPPTNWGKIEFWPKFIPTYINLIRRQVIYITIIRIKKNSNNEKKSTKNHTFRTVPFIRRRSTDCNSLVFIVNIKENQTKKFIKRAIISSLTNYSANEFSIL